MENKKKGGGDGRSVERMGKGDEVRLFGQCNAQKNILFYCCLPLDLHILIFWLLLAWHNVLLVQKGLQITLVRVTFSHYGIMGIVLTRVTILMIIEKTTKIIVVIMITLMRMMIWLVSEKQRINSGSKEKHRGEVGKP